MIDASIPLQGRPVQAPESPIKTFGDVMQIRDLASQVQLRQAQTAHAQQQAAEQAAVTEQKTRDQNDQRTIQSYLSDPANAAELYKSGGDLSKSPLAGKVQPAQLFALGKLVSTHAADYEKTRGDKAKNDQQALTEAGKSLQSIYELGKEDPSQIPSLYQGMLQTNPFINDLPVKPPPTMNNLDDVKRAMAVVGGYSGLVQHTLDQRKETAEAADKETTAAKTAAAIPGTVAEGQIKQNQAAGMTAAGLLPNEERERQQAATTAAQKDTELAETAAFHKGELGIRKLTQDREERVFEATYGSGANPALQGVEPKMRTAAAAQAQKAGLKYSQSQTAADEMASIIDLAAGGNKVAAAYAPTTGVLTINSANGSKRINMAEIHQYAGAGSALDAVEGWLGKMVAGQPIPANILEDMRKLHGQLSANSWKTYTDELQTTNNVYRSNFNPATPPPAAALPPPPPKNGETPNGKISVKAPNGNLYYFADQAGADRFKKAAGIQ